MKFDSSGHLIIEKDELLQIWSEALKSLIEIDQALLESDVQERAVCFRLAHYLSQFFLLAEKHRIFVDVEYNRDGEKRKKTPMPDQCTRHWIAPDIILHERGSADDPEDKYRNDIFYCEVKKNDSKNGSDKNRIIEQMCERKYQFGINLYQINKNKIELALRDLNKSSCREIYAYSFEQGKLVKQIETE